MAAKKNIHQDESALFHQAMANVTPLKHSHQHLPTPPQKKRESAPIKPKILTGAETWLSHLDDKDWLSAEDPLHFAKTGLQHKTIQRLKRGQIALEAELDLHRKTLNEAMTAVTHFIDYCVAQSKRCVCIIHGKGRYSAHQKPMLKNFLNQWLRQQQSVLAFYSAIPKQGGTGAIYVLLKRGVKHEK